MTIPHHLAAEISDLFPGLFQGAPAAQVAQAADFTAAANSTPSLRHTTPSPADAPTPSAAAAAPLQPSPLPHAAVAAATASAAAAAAAVAVCPARVVAAATRQAAVVAAVAARASDISAMPIRHSTQGPRLATALQALFLAELRAGAAAASALASGPLPHVAAAHTAAVFNIVHVGIPRLAEALFAALAAPADTIPPSFHSAVKAVATHTRNLTSSLLAIFQTCLQEHTADDFSDPQSASGHMQQSAIIHSPSSHSSGNPHSHSHSHPHSHNHHGSFSSATSPSSPTSMQYHNSLNNNSNSSNAPEATETPLHVHVLPKVSAAATAAASRAVVEAFYVACAAATEPAAADLSSAIARLQAQPQRASAQQPVCPAFSLLFHITLSHYVAMDIPSSQPHRMHGRASDSEAVHAQALVRGSVSAVNAALDSASCIAGDKKTAPLGLGAIAIDNGTIMHACGSVSTGASAATVRGGKAQEAVQWVEDVLMHAQHAFRTAAADSPETSTMETSPTQADPTADIAEASVLGASLVQMHETVYVGTGTKADLNVAGMHDEGAHGLGGDRSDSAHACAALFAVWDYVVHTGSGWPHGDVASFRASEGFWDGGLGVNSDRMHVPGGRQGEGLGEDGFYGVIGSGFVGGSRTRSQAQPLGLERSSDVKQSSCHAARDAHAGEGKGSVIAVGRDGSVVTLCWKERQSAESHRRATDPQDMHDAAHKYEVNERVRAWLPVLTEAAGTFAASAPRFNGAESGSCMHGGVIVGLDGGGIVSVQRGPCGHVRTTLLWLQVVLLSDGRTAPPSEWRGGAGVLWASVLRQFMHAPLLVQLSLTQQVLGMASCSCSRQAALDATDCPMHGRSVQGDNEGRCKGGSGGDGGSEVASVSGSSFPAASLLRARGVLMSYVIAAIESC